MRTYNIEIIKCFLCTLDEDLPFPNYNEVKLGTDDDIYKYVMSLLSANVDSISAKRAVYDEDSFLASIVPETEESLEPFVNIITEEIYEIVKENAEMHSGSGIFVWALVEEQPVMAFFKMNFQNKFMCYLSELGNVAWNMNSKILPTSTQKDYEFFIINVFERTVLLSDCEYYVYDRKCNYLSEHVLKLRANKSEKKIVKEFDDAVVNTIKECYDEVAAPVKILEYKSEIAKNVESTGNINAETLKDTVFADNEIAATAYQEKIEQESIPVQPIAVSPKTQKTLNRKQKIVTDTGIEILIPLDLIDDSNVFQYRQDDNGKISIILSDIGKIINK